MYTVLMMNIVTAQHAASFKQGDWLNLRAGDPDDEIEIIGTVKDSIANIIEGKTHVVLVVEADDGFGNHYLYTAGDLLRYGSEALAVRYA